MAELFAVAPENLTDTHRVDDLAADDAALIEPLACVMKAIRRASPAPGESVAVIGLGFMGLLHARVLPGCTGYEPNPARAAAARALGIRVAETDIEESADVIFVLPGVQAALDRAVYLAAPGARIVLFAPWPPGQDATLPATAYFKDLTLSNAYSAGPNDTSDAVGLLRQGRVRAAQVVSHFISLDDLPAAYIAMREGRMLKAMVSFGTKASG
jgi:L-iditol 2-dehydrogenase